MLRASDETSHGSLALVRPHTLHQRVAVERGQMDPFHLGVSPHVVGQSGFYAASVKIALTNKENK